MSAKHTLLLILLMNLPNVAAPAEPPAWPSHAEYMAKSKSPSAGGTSSTAPAGSAVPASSAYILQVGAFRQRTLAERAATELGLEGLQVVATRRGDQNWYLLVLGSYPSRVDAQEAGQAFLDTHPAGAIWVRAARGLEELPTSHR